MNKPTDSVRLVVFSQDSPDHFLILTEADDPDNWKLPGGKFDTEHETDDEAMEREKDQELGENTITIRKAAELINNDGVSRRVIYVGTAPLADIRATSEEVAEIRWVTEETIPDGPNSEHIRSAVEAARGAA